MIQRSKLAEALRDYHIRSQRKYWQDVAKAILWGFLFLLLVVASFVSMHLKFHKLSGVNILFVILLPICLWISRQRKLAKKTERRMLLPLSM